MNCPPAMDALLYKARAVLEDGSLQSTADAPPPSPCISVCKMNPTRSHCVGCLRTLDELRMWGKADAAIKRSIWQSVLERCALPVADKVD